MTTVLADIFWFIVTFSILVVLHEGGHFLVARAFGVHVSRVHDRPAGPGAALPRQEDRLRHHGGASRRVRAHLGHGARARRPAPRPGAGLHHAAPATRRSTSSRRPGLDLDDADVLTATLVDWNAISPPTTDEDTFDANLPRSSPRTPRRCSTTARSTTFRGLSTRQAHRGALGRRRRQPSVGRADLRARADARRHAAADAHASTYRRAAGRRARRRTASPETPSPPSTAARSRTGTLCSRRSPSTRPG